MRRTFLGVTTMLIIGAAAGCGTASASTTPQWHAPGSAPPSVAVTRSAPSVTHSSTKAAPTTAAPATAAPSTAAPSTMAPSAAAPSAAPVPSDPVESATVTPTHSTPAAVPRSHGSGPAGSLMQTGTSSVALTFDDGPDPQYTPALLDLLAKNHVKATFCLVGLQVRAHPDLVRRIAHDGHTLCNHSWNHNLTLGKTSPAAIRADLAKTNAAIRTAVPDARIPYFRAPGGNFTDPMATVAADLGMRSIYWDLDPRDWDHTTDASDTAHRSRVVHAVEHEVRKGSIVLSHDYEQPQTIQAYKTLLPWLTARYELVALP